MATRAGFLHDDPRLNKLCREGNLRKVVEFTQAITDSRALADRLSNRKGVFGYTPLHEAVASGHAKLLDFLLEKAGDVNCRANSGYTPLHLAASSGHAECVRVLLKHNADISMTDEYGKTPKQTAELSLKSSIVKLLRSEEIIKEVMTNGPNLAELLKVSPDQLESNCLNRALEAAVRNDNHFNMSNLIVKGADNLKECLALASDPADLKPHARAMLLLVKAAKEGNHGLVLKLFGEGSYGAEAGEMCDEGFVDVQRAVIERKVSTVVPIEIARRNGHTAVREKLLMKTDVNREEGTVYWHGLRLLELDVSWLRKIHWVQRLRLGRNNFKSLPNEMGSYLKQVVRLDLQHNELTTFPHCILELPSLRELNLSYNRIVEIPNVAEWSPALTVFDLSRNRIHSLPTTVTASNIKRLVLSYNHFRNVPMCICSFTTLQTLDLSYNPDILTLPAEMGRLTSLTSLFLNGLKDLNDPPRNIQKDTGDTIRYLKNKLRAARGFYRMKLMLVGLANRGKTTLVARLLGKDCGNESTVGVEVSEWLHRPGIGKRPFHFSIWDFGGQEEYYATHQCFLSHRSLYLILFNLKDEEKGVQELRPWLNNIAVRAPHSRAIIVGTHLDEIPDDKRGNIDRLLRKAGELVQEYCRGKLEIGGIVPVGLKDRIENISALKETIYNQAATYKVCRGGEFIMGQKIPASYFALDRQLEVIQQEVRSGVREPIMHAEEFKTMVQQMNLVDIQDEDELKTATLFLSDIGSLLHYDDRSHNLHELYFIDPCWLCDMMAKVVTIRERNPFVQSGILHSRDIPMIFKDSKFPSQYHEQYFTLLDRFEIALPLDNKRILIPSMLKEERCTEVDINQGQQPLYSRYIVFKTSDTPPGFWSRLLSRIMHSVPEVCFALNKSSPENIQDGASLTIGMPPVTASTSCSLTSSDASSLNSLSISGPIVGITPIGQIPEVTSQQLLPHPVLPNFPSSLPFHNMADTFDAKQLHLKYWRLGLYYSDPEVAFRIESLSSAGISFQHGKGGVAIVASSNNRGKKIIGQLVDIAISLVNDWYPGLYDGASSTAGHGLEQIVPCYECLKAGVDDPFEFSVEDCLSNVSNNLTTIMCGYNKEGSGSINHTVQLEDIVPDLLLQDIDSCFLLNIEDLYYTEDKSSLLGKGSYGKVFKGTYGKECQRRKPVAIKKYHTRNEEALRELRTEAKLLQKCHHPCLVCLVGVCINPFMALVMEEAPKGSLELHLIKKKCPVHRIVLYRIATEIAAALRFLHSRGIIFRDLKAQNVLLWTLDPESLCHTKLTDFGVATHACAIGTKGLTGTKGFIAPEVLHVGKRKEHTVYDNKADIFSFAMFLYQLIARRHPYHDILPLKIDSAVEAGTRPKLQDVSKAETAFHYLTYIMKACWEDNPCKRPGTEEIITTLCRAPILSIMCVHPLRSRFSLRQVLAITQADFTKTGEDRSSSELWVCCDGMEGAEVNMYTTNTMVKVGKNFIMKNQVQCISLCTDHVWISSRAGIEYGVIDIFSTSTRELVHNIRMRESSVSCIASTDRTIYLGTLEGYVFAYPSDVKAIKQNSKPNYKFISEHAVEGLVITEHHCWASHTRYIYFLNQDSLTIEGTVHYPKGFIGQLCLSADGQTVWSAHRGESVLSAWDAYRRTNKFHLNVGEHLRGITKPDQHTEHDFVITAMTPALDTVWIGMASGHILVYHNEDMLAWFHPYKEYVRFIACIPGTGPCTTEGCMVVSGGKVFQSPLPKIGEQTDYIPMEEKEQRIGRADNAGYVILWEAFSAKSMRQIRMLQEDASDCFNNYNNTRMMIRRGEFTDGTHVMNRESIEVDSTSEMTSINSYGTLTEKAFTPQLSFSNSLQDDSLPYTLSPTSSTHDGAITDQDACTSEGELQSSTDELSVYPQAHSNVSTFDVKVTEPCATIVRVVCPQPVKLDTLLVCLQKELNFFEKCHLEYCQSDSGERIPIQSQQQLNRYMQLENKPQLYLLKVKGCC